MRIIIELDTSTQPEIQVGSQSIGNLASNQGAPQTSDKAIDAGAAKVGTLQPPSTPQEMDSSGQQIDTGSAGAAPGNING